MCNEKVIRRFAGTFILLSCVLGWWVSPYWFLFTAFVGVNLIQSTITGICPLERVLGYFGAFGCRPRSAESRAG
jgi:Inner membrane protein YgaP-like, transmembrane domain